MSQRDRHRKFISPAFRESVQASLPSHEPKTFEATNAGMHGPITKVPSQSRRVRELQYK